MAVGRGALGDAQVLVTRPAHQAEELCRLIRAQGGEPVLFPVLEIAEPRDREALVALMRGLADFDIAIFISPNAVARAMNLIQAHGGLPAGLRLATVGKGSARELARFARAPDIAPVGRFDSEALLERPELQDVAGRRIVIFRGEGGRELLADTLAQRGAHVEYAEVYRRVKPQADTSELLRRWARGGVDVAVITSNEGLHNLYEMVGSLGRQWLRITPLVVVSERSVTLARELGFKSAILVAPQASDEGLVEGLLRWRAGG